ncbi:DUF1302 family protein [Gracilinema caldarium]|uniref:Uncharacterized protein n=1 Tax=Gracilinema caldarium (strain ATCC 51460 / DSM 7334 / H1) TaxID=744872 RepID=F8EZU3_GRAC1|nr:DUF1302 family protein [Gracilinema caldarium]AEJ18456.1 hypothetical protein Spica_0290 [Gracilinema caldarium DSM 7334]
MKYGKLFRYTTVLGTVLCLLINQSVFAQFDELEQNKKSALEINGYIESSAQTFISQDDIEALGDEKDTGDRSEINTLARIDLHYKNSASEATIRLNLDPRYFSEKPENIVNEAYVDAYVGNVTLSAGKKKIVWGKGDELHVVDMINANDYRDFIFPKYIDRRIAEPLVHVTYNVSEFPLQIEAVWTPAMTADWVPSSGNWVPDQAVALKDVLEKYVGYQYSTIYSTGGAINSLQATQYLADHSSAEDFLPNTLSLDYSQYALRATGTVGIFDWGLSYYLGHFKTPSVTYNIYNTVNGPIIKNVELVYDRLQVFGLEGAFALGPWNVRMEGAYYLTKDTEGDDPAVKNNRLAWVAGFDIDIPIHNVNLNMQTQGVYILGSGYDVVGDVDYNSEGYRSDNKLVLKISDSFDHERIKPSVKAIYGVEYNEYLLIPELDWKIADELYVNVQAGWFFGDSHGAFDTFMDNDFVKLTARYNF